MRDKDTQEPTPSYPRTLPFSFLPLETPVSGIPVFQPQLPSQDQLQQPQFMIVQTPQGLAYMPVGQQPQGIPMQMPVQGQPMNFGYPQIPQMMGQFGGMFGFGQSQNVEKTMLEKLKGKLKCGMIFYIAMMFFAVIHFNFLSMLYFGASIYLMNFGQKAIDSHDRKLFKKYMRLSGVHAVISIYNLLAFWVMSGGIAHVILLCAIFAGVSVCFFRSVRRTFRHEVKPNWPKVNGQQQL